MIFCKARSFLIYEQVLRYNSWCIKGIILVQSCSTRCLYPLALCMSLISAGLSGLVIANLKKSSSMFQVRQCCRNHPDDMGKTHCPLYDKVMWVGCFSSGVRQSSYSVVFSVCLKRSSASVATKCSESCHHGVLENGSGQTGSRSNSVNCISGAASLYHTINVCKGCLFTVRPSYHVR